MEHFQIDWKERHIIHQSINQLVQYSKIIAVIIIEFFFKNTFENTFNQNQAIQKLTFSS